MASFDLPAELSARYRPLAALEGPPGVQQYEVRDGNGRRVLLTLTARPTLFDDPLSAFHGAAGECFVPGTPPTPVAAIARALHRLDHAAVPRSLAAGAVERRPYVVTAPARGVPLADHPLPLRASEVVELARALFSVLAHAHARGVVHRALTLQNVHWSPDGVGLDGFGFASIDGLAPPAMAIDAVIRAPEVVDEKSAVDPAVDLYAAGVVLYAALSGAPPFSEPQSLAFDHAFSSVPPMPPGTPPALGALVNGLLQKERDKRTPSALAALTALANASADRLRATTDPLVQLTAAAARPGRAFSALRARETIDDVNPLTAARLLLRLDRAEGALRICVSAEDRSGARAEMRVLAGRSLLALGRVEEGIKAFGLALDATPPPSIASMLDLIDAAAAVPRHDVAVDAAIRAGVLAPEQGVGALGRVVGLAVRALPDPPDPANLLPLAVACTHLGLRAIEAGEEGTTWFQRGRELGQAGLVALVGPVAPPFPLHVALCAWGTGDVRAASRSLDLALKSGLKVPARLGRPDPLTCLRLALLVTHQRAKAVDPPTALVAWAEGLAH